MLKRNLLVLLVLFALSSIASASFSDSGFSAYNPTSVDNAVAWSDIDKDGYVDMYLGSGGYTEAGLFINDWDAASSTAFTANASAGPGANNCGLFVDYDNDGDLDIYTSQSGAHLSVNNGNGTFTQVNGGLTSGGINSQSECHVWADFNNDGYLDFYRAGWQDGDDGDDLPEDTLFINNAGVSFSNVDIGGDRNSRSVVACDFDEDGDVDVYVSNYLVQENNLYQNDGDANFIDVAVAYGVAGDPCICEAGNPYIDEYRGGFTIASAWGDLDNDGHFDLVVGNFSHSYPCNDRPQFYRNKGGSPDWTFEDKTASVALPWVESHASPALADYDNDGDLDVFITAVAGPDYTGQKCTMMHNDGSWGFTDVSVAENLDITTTTANFQAAWADYDNDGDLDLFTGRKLYINGQTTGNNWLKVKLMGRDGINRDAIGTQVRITISGLGTLTRQVESVTGWGNQNDLMLHFGLGSTTGPIDLDITWPDGTQETVTVLTVNKTIAIASPSSTVVDPTDDLVTFGAGTNTVQPVTWDAARTLAGPDYLDDPYGDTDNNTMPIASSADFGLLISTPLTGDVDGDGIDDIVVAHDNGAGGITWVASHSVDTGGGVGALGSTSDSGINVFGLAGDYFIQALLGDITGDGRDDAILVQDKNLNGNPWWYCMPSDANGLSGSAQQGDIQWGLPGDQYIVGDFDGDGYDDFGIYRPVGGNIIWSSSAGGVMNGGGTGPIGQIGGSAGDELIIANLNGDVYDDAVMVRDNGVGGIQWFGLINDGTGNLNFVNPGTTIVNFGLYGVDTPFVADINGDGMDDICVARPVPDGRANEDGLKRIYVGFTTTGGALYSGAVGDDVGDFGVSSDTILVADLDSGGASDLLDDLLSYSTYPDIWSGSRTDIAPEYANAVTDTDMYLPTFIDPNYMPMMGDVTGDGIDDLVLREPDADAGDPEKPAWKAYHSYVNSQGLGYLSQYPTSSMDKFGGLTSNIVAQFLADINGDGADDAVSLNISYNWSAIYSIPGSGLDENKVFETGAVQFGLAGDIPLISDFNGDGYQDKTVYRSGTWITDNSSAASFGDGAADTTPFFGGFANDIPLVGDINGDGRDDAIIVRDNLAGGFRWYVAFADVSGNIVDDADPSLEYEVDFGFSSGTPFVGDFNGDGMDDIGIIHNGNERYIHYTTTGGKIGPVSPAPIDDSVIYGDTDGIQLVAQLGTTCPISDLDDDCDVDLFDFAKMADKWLQTYILGNLEILADEWLMECPGGAGCL